MSDEEISAYATLKHVTYCKLILTNCTQKIMFLQETRDLIFHKIVQII